MGLLSVHQWAKPVWILWSAFFQGPSRCEMGLWVVTSPACMRAGWRWAAVGGGMEVCSRGPGLHDSRGHLEANTRLHTIHCLQYKRHPHTVLSAAMANMQHLTRERSIYSQQCPATNSIPKPHRLGAVAAQCHVFCQIN